MCRFTTVVKHSLATMQVLLLVSLGMLAFPAAAQNPGPVSLQGTGGTITTQGSNIIHTFTVNGTFVRPPGLTQGQVLVVGGGGGGGSRHGGGGGGGGVVYHPTLTITLPSYSVVIGNGGTFGQTSPTNGTVGTNGGNSSFGTMVALGGGGGGSYTAPVPTGGGSGGGGGGVGGTGGGTGDGAGGNRNGGLANQGNSAGGTGYGNGGGVGAGPGTVANFTGGGGGGGANGAGGAASGQFGGTGGAGRTFSISGSSVFYAGGGGGGSGGGVANIAPGGTGGGGNGGSLGGPGSAGTANTGGGGGGARSDTPGGTTATRGGNGGSGIVIVRYPAPTITLTQEPAANPTSGIAFAQQPVVRILNGAGTPVSGVNITASIASGSGSLGGTVTVATNGSGLANFTNLAISGTGNHTIRFTPAGSTQSVVSIVVNIQPPSISLTQQPSALATTTVAFAQQPTVQLLYSGSPAVSVNITASIATGSGSLGGTVTVPINGSGLAVFSNLVITGSGDHTLRFTAAGSGVTVDSNTIDVSPPAVSIAQEPSISVTDTVVFPQQPIVQLLYNGSPAVSVNIVASIETGSGTLGGTVSVPTNGSGQAVFTNLFINGTGNHTLNFSPTGFTEEVISLEIFVGPAPVPGCPGYDGTSSPVIYKGCTETKVPGENISQQITLTTPPTTVVGDLLIAGIAIDESHTVNALAGWTLINQDNAGNGGQAASFAAFYKFATAADLVLPGSNHTFSDVPFGGGAGSTPVQAAKYGWMMNFSGAAGISAVGFTPDGGASNPAVTPPVTTTSNNNLILRLGGFDDSEIAVDTPTLMAGYTRITVDNSHDDGAGNSNGDSVSGGAAYAVQASPGVSPAVNFTNFINTQRWVTMSLAIEPLPTQFRISHAGVTNNCAAPINVTIRATDDSNNPITTYTGTMELSTNTGFGTWGIGTGNGVLTPGGSNPQGVDDGTATYTFDPADNGVVTLTFSSPMAGLHNFDIVDSDNPTIVESVDPDLNVAFCPTYEFAISNSGPTDTCTPATVNFRVAQTGGGPTLYGYTGTISISNDIAAGSWSVGSTNGSLVAGSGDGTASYTFDTTDYSVAALSFYSNTADPTVNFDADDGSFSDAGVDGELVITLCAPSSPTIFDFSCEINTDGTLAVNIESQANNSNRMVVMTFGSEGDPVGGAGATTATFDVGGLNTAMVQLAQSYIDDGGNDALAEIWGVLDAGLPTTGGSYVATHANSDTTRAMCLISFVDVEQNFPLTGVTAPNGGGNVVNINYEADSGAGGVPSPADDFIDTSITVAENNSYVVSVVENGSNGPYSTLGLTGDVFGNFDLAGSGAGFASAGQVQNAGALNVQDDAGVNANRQAQSVAAFAPVPFTASQFSITHNNTGGTCSANLITISALTDAGTVDTNYTGTITLEASSDFGDWSDVSGTNSVNNGTINDGDATYTFDAADNGVVVLGFSQISAGSVNFNVSDGPLTESVFFDNDLVIGDCAYRISTTGNHYSCTAEAITITAVDGSGNTLTGFTGLVTLTTNTNHGSWSIGSGAGNLIDLTAGDGQATYEFAVGDNGSADLGFHSAFIESVNIDVDDGTYSEEAGYDPNISVQACEFSFTVNSTGDTCTSEPVTISVFDGDGDPGILYAGTMTITTNTGNGTWSLNSGNGSFTSLGIDSGGANYNFDATDAGVVILDFKDIHEEDVNFTLTGSGYTFDPGSNPDISLVACAFRISHSGSADQCTQEAVTITAVDGSGNTLTSYAGTISLSTVPGNGTWSLNTGSGAFSDPVAEDGSASYTFVPADNGVVVLDYLNRNAETVNFNITDGSYTEDSPAFDPDLDVDNCTFRISVATGSLTACTFETVTIGVYDSGGVLATNYAGTVDITTDTANGNWVSTTGAGTLTDVNPNDGIATYAFDASDGGSVDIQFADETVETVNINLDDNGIIEDSGFDPSLSVTACQPVISDVQCYANQNQANAITLPSSAASGASRMVLMYTSTESLTPASGATLDGGTYVMSELKNETANFGIGQVLQVYGILDADLPPGAGTYSAQFTGSANNPAMCLVAVQGVAQTFPADNGDSTGQLNGSNAQNTTVASTSITTVANNSLLLSVVANGQDNTAYTSTLGNVLWTTGVADAASSDWAGNSEYQPTTGLVQIDETNDGTPNRHAHIVMALAPIVAGNPYAPDYVPVSLFQTYSGNINFRAIGNTLRTSPNPANATYTPQVPPNPPGPYDSCSFVPEATGSTAVMNLPAAGTNSIVASYLYWAGSGTEAQEDATITFGPVGSEISITADDMFHVVGAYGGTTEFFAGFKDITALVSSAPSTTYHLSDLTVQTGAPWSAVQGCLGGWGMVVVYENALENLNIINLFHGFQPFRYSSFQLVPRNFRMATPDGGNIPNGQLTHLTFEGDDSLNEPGELLELQNDPNALTFTPLVNSVNPAILQGGGADAQYNDTITHPAYDGSLNFLPAGGDDGQGYFIDSEISWGTDVDTYYMQGANPGDILYPFGSQAAEQITTRYGSGQDGVLLVGEFISVTNAPIADLEVFINASGSFKTASAGTGMYSYTVTNNGNGAVSGGFADGDVVLTINLPIGMTAASITPNGWTCTPDVPVPNATAFTCVFDIVTANVAPVLDDELDAGESLPDVEITVNLDDESSYPLLDNPVTQSARIAHFADYANSGMYPSCVEAVIGVQPDPTLCSKAPQFDNVNDLNKNTIDIDDLDEKQANNNNVVQQLTTVLGIRTDLSMDKSVIGVLEENEPAQYQLVVTNLGPDPTSKTMTITDTLPAGLVPNTAVGTGWVCNIVSQNVTCTRSASLGVGSSTTVNITTVSVVSPAVEGAFVSNTAVVQAGTYNFDQVPGNNSNTDITEVVGDPVASNEKFLITVNETSAIGGLGPFEDGDLVLYDPVLDTATMFLAESSIPANTDLGNINAMHLLPNGQILLSTADDGSEIANVDFNAEDIVLYDPILMTATLIFDGSTVFDADTANIDALYVVYNDSYDPNDWDIIFSVADDADIAAVTYDDNDLISFDVMAGTASLLVDGNSGDMFNGDNGDIDAAYRRVDDANKYVLSTDDASATIGIDGIQDTYTQDDLVEIDLATPGSPDAGNVFLGDVINGVFTPSSGTRKLNGVHVIEDGYYGHFAIVHGGIGDTCTPTTVTIRRHAGLSHTVDTNYAGSINISNDIAQGTWTKDISANGTLTDMSGGVAQYTFEPADNGEVILYLTQTSATVMNVDVTNYFNEEDSVEDADITINDVVTLVSYQDQFSAVAYNNNDGIASFATNWVETNDDSNPASGAVKIVSNRLNITNPGGNTFPAIERTIDFSSYTPNTGSNPLTLNFSWSRTNGAPADAFIVQGKSQSSDPGWTNIQTFNGLAGAVASTPVSLNLTTAGISPTASTQIRFLASAGYQLESFNIDNIDLTTATNDCNVGGTVDHYAITHSGFGISCLVSNVTIIPHTVADVVTQPGVGVTLTLNTADNRGTWGAPIGGTGAFSAVPGTGQASYTYTPGEDALVFPFNYTLFDPLSNTVSVNIDVDDDLVPFNSESIAEDPSLTMSRAGLRFFNDTNSNGTYPTLVSGMDSFLYTGEVLTVQAIRASDQNPAVCESIFAPATDVQIELAFECADPAVCSAGVIPVDVINNGNTTSIEPVDDNAGSGANAGGYDPITLRFESFSNGDFDQDPGPGKDFSYTGAQIRLNYADAGSLQIHGRYNIPFLDGIGVLSNNYMEGSGDNNFVVRPFGYDVDVLVGGMPDRETNIADVTAADSWATNANGSAAFTAGVGFDTIVTAVSWEAEDDDGSTGGVANDGIPDPGAYLYDNDPTPNYGNETDPAENDMTITHVLNAAMPVGAVTGTLSTSTFTNFGANNGSETHSMDWDEVGIIDLTAALDGGDYLGGGDTITGELPNLGRFIPADFTVTMTNLIDRPLFTPPTATFTYMGEEFTAEFTLTARNAATDITKNYFGDFAKLDTLAEMNFYAIQDIDSGDDIDYTTRLAGAVSNGFPASFSGDWAAGVVSLGGNLIFNRQASGAPEAPLTPTIAVTVEDDDMVIDTGRTVDNDDGITEPGTALYNLIGIQEFRYGRLRLENAFGSEIPEEAEDGDDLNVDGEDLPIYIIAEYFDGTEFVLNTDDVATPYNSSNLDYVPGSFTDNLTTATITVTLGNGVIYQGETEEQGANDAPLYLTAPGEGFDGTAYMELDLDTPNLQFLKYDWRGVGEIEDDNADADYSDDPRALIEFGTFLLHQRIINWQELFQ